MKTEAISAELSVAPNQPIPDILIVVPGGIAVFSREDPDFNPAVINRPIPNSTVKGL